MGDVLAVQEQLDAIQPQIEQLQGQLQLLTSQTAYSTLTVDVSRHATPARPGPAARVGPRCGPGTPASAGSLPAWRAIRLAGPVLFALLCLGVLCGRGRVLWRRYQRHRL